MGWTYMQRNGRETADQYFRKEFEGEAGYEILASATVNLTEYYAAVKTLTGPRAGEVWAFVAMIRYTRDGDFGYKDMDETVGPCQHNCPAKILDLLTPTDSEWANQWRAACRETIAKRAAKKAFKPGMRVKLLEGENWNHFRAKHGDVFTVVTYGKRGRAYLADDGYKFRLPASTELAVVEGAA